MSATMMMNPTQQQLPHRKPVPAHFSYNNVQQQAPPSQYSAEQQRARTNSNVTSLNGSPSTYSMQQQQAQYSQTTRRTPSTNTASTNSSLQRTGTNASAPRRSTSSRSNSSASPTSYVALMRKQKATVWCDRAQHEDPHIIARQRAAKMRAAMEVAGGSHRVSTSSNQAAQSVGIRSKIRHGGAPKASTYTGRANLAGAGVPMRLSASEVDENDSDEEQDSKYMNYHNRDGSRGSSVGSGQHPSNFLHSGSGSTPQSGRSPVGSMGDLAEEETPVPNEYNTQAGDYLQAGGSDDGTLAEQSFGGLSQLPQSTGDPERDRKTAEDLRRRGSVDDRSMTMTGVKLFIANPDLSD